MRKKVYRLNKKLINQFSTDAQAVDWFCSERSAPTLQGNLKIVACNILYWRFFVRVGHDTTYRGSRLMRISLLRIRISLLRFFKKIHKFALCEFMPYALSYFISLLRFFGQKYLPYVNIWLFHFISAIFLAIFAQFG